MKITCITSMLLEIKHKNQDKPAPMDDPAPYKNTMATLYRLYVAEWTRLLVLAHEAIKLTVREVWRSNPEASRQ